MSQTKQRRSNQVQFSHVNLATYLEDEDVKHLKWYSGDELFSQRTEFLMDVARMRELLAHIQQQQHLGTMTYANLPQEIINECCGMEHLLSDDLARNILEKRQRHLISILAEQQRQFGLNVTVERLLRCVSEMHSIWARSLAHMIADAHSATVDRMT